MDPKPVPADETVRAHIWVKGRVQGVGFRAYVEYRARRIEGLTGWVRNVGYETVEAVVEGPRARVEQIIEAMRTGPHGAHVDESKVEWEGPRGEFASFGVARSM